MHHRLKFTLQLITIPANSKGPTTPNSYIGPKSQTVHQPNCFHLLLRINAFQSHTESMKEIIMQRRHGPSPCRLHCARMIRISILLLQLLCLPTYQAAAASSSADREETALHQRKQIEIDDSLEHHNLRVAQSSSMGYLASFTDAVYALLETVGLYHADSTISQEQGEAGVSTKVNEFPGDIRDERSLDSAEYSREDRRLGRQRENGSRTVDMKWCE